ncbi:MAG: AAA family ATPase [Patescibacteria group bacterium]
MLEDKLGKHFKQTIIKSFQLAKLTGCDSVLPCHLLLAMLKQKGNLASELLRHKHLETELMELLQKKRRSRPLRQIPTLSLASEQIIVKAVKTAFELNHPYVGTDHLFFSLIQNQPDDLKRLLDKKIELKKIQTQIKARFKGTSRFPEIRDMFNMPPQDEMGDFGTLNAVSRKHDLLEYFAEDLTDPEKQSNFMPLIGRQNEIAQLIQILCRKNKNNPLLLGDPGVGKTAIVEGLAQKIYHGLVPDILLDKKIMSLDMGSLVAGTMYRGDFEARVKQILEEIKSNPNIILFIDEIHQLTGAGSANGSLDAANMFKPLLARGELRCIGATTAAEYKKSFAKDSALARRFQPMIVAEPSKEETFAILRGLRNCYEEFHQIQISDNALSAAIELSDHYLAERFQPDKSLDILDEAASRLKIDNIQMTGRVKKIREIEKIISEMQKKKEAAVRTEDYNQAINIAEEMKREHKKLNNLKNEKPDEAHRPILDETHLRKVLAQKLNIDISQVSLSANSGLINLAEKLNRQVIGQEFPVEKITAALKRSYSGLRNPKRPLASFIFAGPSGVGKTFLAQTLAELLFSGKNNLIRLDMSEFNQQFNISKLIGAPAGYIGYQEENKFTDQIKKMPHSIILFDEIEKAHRDVYNLLLQILDNGQITDASGQVASFRHAIIIMTSNLGNTRKNTSIGFGAPTATDQQAEIMSEIKKFFSPELIGRLDEILVFNSLDLQNLKKIATIEIDKLKYNLEKLGKKLAVQDLVLDRLADECFKSGANARGLIKLIEEKIIGPVSEKLILNPHLPEIKIDIAEDKININ